MPRRMGLAGQWARPTMCRTPARASTATAEVTSHSSVRSLTTRSVRKGYVVGSVNHLTWASADAGASTPAPTHIAASAKRLNWRADPPARNATAARRISLARLAGRVRSPGRGVTKQMDQSVHAADPHFQAVGGGSVTTRAEPLRAMLEAL